MRSKPSLCDRRPPTGSPRPASSATRATRSSRSGWTAPSTARTSLTSRARSSSSSSRAGSTPGPTSSRTTATVTHSPCGGSGTLGPSARSDVGPDCRPGQRRHVLLHELQSAARPFQQSLWAELEDYLLNSADTQGFRASVFTGPVFAPEDPPYRGVRLPAAYPGSTDLPGWATGLTSAMAIWPTDG